MTFNPIEILRNESEPSKRAICVSLAKRDIIDNIYRSAALEGIATTFIDTERIYNNMEISGFRADEIITIVNLKHSWWYLFGTLDEEPSLDYVCNIHKLIGTTLYEPAGRIRNVQVRIGGTSYLPEMPQEYFVRESIRNILVIEDPTTRALNLMCYLMRSQIFIDGNKRTSMLIANQILISTGTGILSVPVDLIDEFKKLIVSFYETNNNATLIHFLKEKCIQFI